MPDSMPKDMPDRTRGSDYVSLCQNIFENLRAAAPAADPGQKKRWTWCCRRSSRNSRHPRTQLVCFFLEFQEVWLWPAYWGLLNKYLLMKGSRWHSLHCLNTWQNNWSIVQVASPPRSLLGFVISFSPSPKPLRVKSPWKQLLGSTSDAFNTFIPTDILLITMWPPPSYKMVYKRHEL